MVFNSDQRDHMNWVAGLAPEDRCACGWDSLDNCLRGLGGPGCTAVKVEVTTDPDVVLVEEWQASESRRHPGDFLGWPPSVYENWVDHGILPGWHPEPDAFPYVGYRVWETTRTVEEYALIYDAHSPEHAALLYADADGGGQRDDGYSGGRQLNVRSVVTGDLFHATVGLQYEPEFVVQECKPAEPTEPEPEPQEIDLGFVQPGTVRTFYPQKGSEFPDALPRALANVCVELGVAHPGPGTDPWETVIDRAQCRLGPSLVPVDLLAREVFGLHAKRVNPHAVLGRQPLLLTVRNPEPGPLHHLVLILGWEGAQARVVNYRMEAGPLMETLPVRHDDPPPRSQRWEALYVPPPPGCVAFLLSVDS